MYWQAISTFTRIRQCLFSIAELRINWKAFNTLPLQLDLDHVIDLVSFVGEPFPLEEAESFQKDGTATAAADCLGIPAIGDSFTDRYCNC